MINESRTVADIALAVRGAARVFESHRIDYCGGGKRTLREACERAHVSIDTIVAELDALGGQAPESWGSVTSLVAHIIDVHHAKARNAMDHLTPLANKVRRVHGLAHPELHRVVEIFDVICAELGPHMRAEEDAMFPAILQMVRPDCDPRRRDELRLSVTVMQHDHDEIGKLLHELREVTSDYEPPPEACTSYRLLYQGLEDFEQDLHAHIHLENNVLLPRAVTRAS